MYSLKINNKTPYIGSRLDKVLFSYLTSLQENITRSHITDSIKNSLVRINSKVILKAGIILKDNDLVEFSIRSRESNLSPDSEVKFEIIYQDKDLFVINKPPGLVVHPGSGVREKTLVNGILSHLEKDKFLNKNLNNRPGIVHRLDKGTSGVMLIAKNEQTLNKLQKQFLPPRTINRTYLAYVSGRIKKLKGVTLNTDSENITGTINAPITRHTKNRTIFMVSKNFEEGRSAVTNFSIIKEENNFSLVQLELETGRTHQIRVHLSYIGLPIVGDTSYGGQNLSLRPLLHAYKIKFIHPSTDEVMEFSAEIPEDFKVN